MDAMQVLGNVILKKANKLHYLLCDSTSGDIEKDNHARNLILGIKEIARDMTKPDSEEGN